MRDDGFFNTTLLHEQACLLLQWLNEIAHGLAMIARCVVKPVSNQPDLPLHAIVVLC